MNIKKTIPSWILAILAAVIPSAFTCNASAQTTVEVNNGQVLTIADLMAGTFQGVNFELGPMTTFKINAGGRYGKVGDAFSDNTFDFEGSTFEVYDGAVFGNCINPDCGVLSNLNLNVYGGLIISTLQTGSGTVANLFGGDLGNTILEAGSVVNIRGGSVGLSLLSARPGSELNISGGLFRNFHVQTGSAVTLFGDEFRLNGSAYTNPTVSLTPGDVLTGTLSDGSVFVIDPSTNLSYSNIMLVTVPVPEITGNDFIIDGTEESVPQSLRSGQSLTLRPGGELDDQFYAQGASINVEGGRLGFYTRVVDAAVTISGGEIGYRFETFRGSTATVTGGTFIGDATAREGSTWSIYGGSLGGFFSARDGSEVNIYGGNLGHSFMSYPDSTVNIYGGTIGSVLAFGGAMTLYVTSAAVNGVPLDLELGVPVEITERGFGSSLNVVLADGSPLSINLAPDYGKPPSPFVDPTANLFVRLVVPEPQAFHMVALSTAVTCLFCCRRLSLIVS